MFGNQPTHEGYGPAEESNREVSARVALDACLMATGYGILKLSPDPSLVGTAGLVLLLAAFIHGGGWLIEGVKRALLWKETRGYANE